MMFDVVEDSQMRTGRRDEGLFLSGPGLFQKIFSGLGVFIIGFVLQFLGFDNSQSSVEQMQEPINNLVFCMHQWTNTKFCWIRIHLLLFYN